MFKNMIKLNFLILSKIYSLCISSFENFFLREKNKSDLTLNKKGFKILKLKKTITNNEIFQKSLIVNKYFEKIIVPEKDVLNIF